ncbi:MAG TPA: hypothetical protein VIK27_01305 [Candidatus Aquilonibacter sp.]
MSLRIVLALIAAVSLAACAHNGAQDTSNGVSTNQAANPSPSIAANPPIGGVTASGEAMAPGTLATVPPKLICVTSQPVWIDTATHQYHVSSDSAYGRTAHGKYVCLPQAKKDGYTEAPFAHPTVTP